MTFVPPLAQILPGRIHGHDEGDFLDSQPALDALLAFDCVVDVFEALEIQEPVKLVFDGKSWADSCFVSSRSAREIVGDADVQSPLTVRHDVDKIHRSFALWLPAAREHAGLGMTNLGRS